MPYIVGLTGGIGSGKSLATRYFSELGIEIIDADIIAREVVQLDSPALNHLTEHFGNEILLPSGELNRSALRERIFSNSDEKAWLENVLHPLILTTIQTRLTTIRSPYGILSSPLLFETQQDQLVDSTLVIDCPEDEQRVRATERDQVSLEQVNQIMAAQLSRNDRCNKADTIINNSGSMHALQLVVSEYHHQLVKKLLVKNS